MQVYMVTTEFTVNDKQHVRNDLIIASSKLDATDQAWRNIKRLLPGAKYVVAEANEPDEVALSPYDRVKLKSMREQVKWHSIGEEVRKRGVYMVQLSPRKYIIVKCEQSAGISWVNGKYIYNTNASVLYGPASHDDCEQWLAENTEEVLPEHKP